LVFASIVALLTGCGARVEASDTDTTEAGKPGPSADAAPASDTGASAVPPIAAEGGVDDPPPDPMDASDPPVSIDPPPSIDCLADDLPAPTRKLTSLFYEKQVGTCPSSDCSDFVDFDAWTCVMKLQTKGVSYLATFPATDCNAFIRWLSSDILVTHLRDMVTCFGKDVPYAFESTQLDLSDGYAAKKTASCPEEPFVSHRACIAKLRAKYFPGR
jgi:hypothetical protein